MAKTKPGSKRIRLATVTALAAIAGGVLLLLLVINARHGTASMDTRRPSLAGATLPTSAASLKGWNVFIQCQPAERGSLVEAASRKGARVQSSLGIDTDLVVTGAGAVGSAYADVRQDAKSLHIPVVDQAQLARFRPSVVQ